MQKELDFINGSLVSLLVKGAKIAWSDFDGWDWHVLIENPKGSEFRFSYHRTLEYSINSKQFSSMVLYNLTPAKALDAVKKEFYSDMFHKQSM